MIDYKQQFIYENLYIKNPIKKDGKWFMELTYDNNKVSFQSPVLKIDKQEGMLFFDTTKKSSFFTFLSDIEKHIIDYIHTNSRRLFDGKEFSLDKIKSSLVSPWNLSNDLHLQFKYGDLSQVKIVSPFGDTITENELNKNVICIFSLDNVVFSKSTFSLDFQITKIRARKPQGETEEFFKPVIEQTENNKPEVQNDETDFFNE